MAKNKSNPKKQIIADIKDSPLAYNHFFQSISQSDWLDLLIEEQIFANPIDSNHVEYPIWYPMQYLEKITQQETFPKVDQERVNKALLSIPFTENAWIHDAYVKILSTLPLNLIANEQHIDKVKKFIKHPHVWLLYVELPKLIKILATGADQHFQIAEEMAYVALDVQQDPSVKESATNGVHKSGKPVATHFRDYQYQQIAISVANDMGVKRPLTTINIFSTLLERVVKLRCSQSPLNQDYDVSGAEDYASILQYPNRAHRQPRHTLVCGLVQSLSFFMQSDIELAEKRKIIEEQVLAKQYPVFYRIAEVVLREYKHQAEYKQLYTDIAKIADPSQEQNIPQLKALRPPKPALQPEQLLELSIDEAVQAIENYQPHFFSPYGLSDLLSSAAKMNPLQMLSIFGKLSSDNWRAQLAMLGALNKQIDQLNEAEITNFVNDIHELSDYLAEMPEEDDWSLASESKRVIIEIATKLIGQKPDKSEYVKLATVQQLIQIILKFARDTHPTPSYEAKYSGTNMDSAMLSVNTIRGGALHALIHSILWMQRNEIDANLLNVIYSELQWHLDSENDPSPAVRSIYGWWLPELSSVNAEWIQKNLDNILTDDDLGNAAWDAYFGVRQPEEYLFQLVKDRLLAWLERISKENLDAEELSTARRNFVAHMTSAFLSESLSIEDDLLRQFFALSPKYSSEALHSLGWALIDGIQLTEIGKKNLQTLFEWRLQVAETNQEQEHDIIEFGSWFASGQFPDDWSWKMLIRTLKITQRIEPDHRVLERLEAVCHQYPVQTIQVLSAMIDKPPKQWSISSWGRSIENILMELITTTGDTRNAAIALISDLITRGYSEYKIIADKYKNP